MLLHHTLYRLLRLQNLTSHLSAVSGMDGNRCAATRRIFRGPLSTAGLAVLLTRMLQEHRIPKVWIQAKIIALEKPGKDPHLAANYQPISLLSVCYKLLERTLLHAYLQ